ncbi:hypothetical protein [Priestia aryabhattai]
MGLEKIALLGTYLSFLWFVPLLFISKKPFEWKIRKLKLFSFIPTIGAYIFVISIAVKLFVEKDYLNFNFNGLNCFFLLFIVLQAASTFFMEIAIRFFNNRTSSKSSPENSLINSRKVEIYLCFALSALFVLDILVRFEIYHLSF